MVETSGLDDQIVALSIQSPSAEDAATVARGSMPAEDGAETTALDKLFRTMTGISTSIYEIEELRHAGPSSGPTTIQVPEMSLLHAELETAYNSFELQVELLREAKGPLSGNDDVRRDLDSEWKKVSKQYNTLKEEMKEDGWLVRFRTTAEQADAMMAPLQGSLEDCLTYLRLISSLPDGLPQRSDVDDEPSVERLEELARSHESMKSRVTYVPSVTRILKMMKKSIQDRSTRNGEALRRLSEMESRWSTLSRQLQQLDGKFRIALSQCHAPEGAFSGDVEVLTEASLGLGSPSREHFGLPGTHTYTGSTPSQRSSMSSNHSGQQIKASLGLDRAKSPAKHDPNRIIRRQPSNVSSATVQDRPRWDIGTRPPPVPTMPAMYQSATNRRLSSVNGARPFDLRSPSPSASSQASVLRGSVAESRIPVRSPPSTPRSETLGPINSQNRLTVPSGQRGQGNITALYQTPPRPRQSVPASLPRSTTPLLGGRSVSYGHPTTPRTEPIRRTLGRNPPSSFRTNTPTPGRPSSRMSNGSVAPVAATLKPFEPSKYDLLDQEVSRLISDVGFNLFVSRLDVPLKKGQRKRDDEEWKGEFVFGAGERTSSVKLLKMVGRAMDGAQVRMKCMCRVGGAWHELSSILRDRMARAQAAPLSP